MASAPFHQRVLAWFDRHGRHDLPWQHPASAYRVWISEIMLQQTRVETVRPYFERFMRRFPDVASLAAADLDEVLEHWAGLGYYARARNLHRAAARIVEQHDGALPQSFDALVALPGIGRSTAAAILSLAHGQRHAILDGNVKRVLARHAGIEGWPGDAAVERHLWGLAQARTPNARAADYNQAMMDIGASVCGRRPRCDECPVAADCRARLDETTATIPAPRPKRSLPRRQTVALVLQRASDGAVLLQRRPPNGIWGGLWSLPEFDDAAAMEQWLASRLGVLPPAEALAPVDHAFTHFHLRIHPRRVVVEAFDTMADGNGHDWCTRARSPGGMPAPVRRLADTLMAEPLA